MLTTPLLPILDPVVLGWQPEAALAVAQQRWPEQLILRTRDLPPDAELEWLVRFESHYPGVLIWNGRLSLVPARTTTLRHYPEAAIPPADVRPFGMSAHSLPAVQRACDVGARWILLSPMRATASHPHAQPMAEATRAACLAVALGAQVAVFGLGGLGLEDLAWAQGVGLTGIAGIRRFFNSPSAAQP